ncbi:MAG: aldo/keto reductase [Mycobacterium sp.]|nr:aldo/keto reductase [Mycobacterium sp.]
MRIIGPDLWGDPEDRPGMHKLLKTVVDMGINLIDTSDVYGPHVSETLIAEALHPYPANVLITTKGGRVLERPGQWGTNSRPERLTWCCEQSLRRLKMDCIDLYQLHAVDPEVPIEESIGALVDLRAAGKIRHIGLSNVTEEEVSRALTVTPIASVQNQYNVLHRDSEPVLQTCIAHGIAFLPWQPVAKADFGNAHRVIAKIAADHDASVVQIALSWLLHHAEVIVPIPGTSDEAHLADNLAAEQICLTAGQLSELDALAPPQ